MRLRRAYADFLALQRVAHVATADRRGIRRRLYLKYPQYPMKEPVGDRDSVVVEITPWRVYAWGFD